MFGVIKGCGCNMSLAERQEWVSHVCGLCLALRDNFGQFSRLATNYDAALLSVLCEAQLPQPMSRTGHLCAIRGQGFQRAQVVGSTPTVQYAASMAVLMAATKLQDHVADGDSWLRYFPRRLTRWPARWATAARRVAAGLNFSTQPIEAQTGRQLEIELQPRRDFFFFARPTELAVGAAFQHTAVIAGCPQNAGPLYRMGQMFGRIMYLLDSYRDYATDVANKKFNALAHCFAPDEIQAQARQIFQQAHAELTHQFNRLALPQPQLARRLLIQQLAQTGRQTLAGAAGVCAVSPGQKKRRRGAGSGNSYQGAGYDAACCDCCYCCVPCSDSGHSDNRTCGCGDSGGCSCCGGGDSAGCGCCNGDNNCCCGCGEGGCDCGPCDCGN